MQHATNLTPANLFSALPTELLLHIGRYVFGNIVCMHHCSVYSSDLPLCCSLLLTCRQGYRHGIIAFYKYATFHIRHLSIAAFNDHGNVNSKYKHYLQHINLSPPHELLVPRQVLSSFLSQLPALNSISIGGHICFFPRDATEEEMESQFKHQLAMYLLRFPFKIVYPVSTDVGNRYPVQAASQNLKGNYAWIRQVLLGLDTIGSPNHLKISIHVWAKGVRQDMPPWVQTTNDKIQRCIGASMPVDSWVMQFNTFEMGRYEETLQVQTGWPSSTALVLKNL